MSQFCGQCRFFQATPYIPGDPPSCWCACSKTKKLIPPIGPLRGPEALGCQFFLPPVDLTDDDGRDPASCILEERFLERPEEFVNVAGAAHHLQKSVSSAYRLVSEGELATVRTGRTGGTINVYSPSILAFLRRRNGAKR